MAKDLGPNGKVFLNTKVDAILRPTETQFHHHENYYYNTHHDNTYGYKHGYGYGSFDDHHGSDKNNHGPVGYFSIHQMSNVSKLNCLFSKYRSKFSTTALVSTAMVQTKPVLTL